MNQDSQARIPALTVQPDEITPVSGGQLVLRVGSAQVC